MFVSTIKIWPQIQKVIGAIELRNTIARLKAEGRERDIQEAIKNISIPGKDKELAHLSGSDFHDYY